jgi:hypothetical protein
MMTGLMRINPKETPWANSRTIEKYREPFWDVGTGKVDLSTEQMVQGPQWTAETNVVCGEKLEIRKFKEPFLGLGRDNADPTTE